MMTPAEIRLKQNPILTSLLLGLGQGTFIAEKLFPRLPQALSSVQLAQLGDERLRRYNLFQEGLTGLAQLRFMKVDPNSEFIPFRFPILCPRMPELRDALELAGVQTRSMFYPLHRQPCLAGLIDPVDLPICDTLYGEGLCLPVHQGAPGQRCAPRHRRDPQHLVAQVFSQLT